MSIDYEKIEGFKSLESKEAKASLATYAQDEFSVKLNKQKSFENMLADLEAAIPKEEPEPVVINVTPEPHYINVSVEVVDANKDFAESAQETAPEIAEQVRLVEEPVVGFTDAQQITPHQDTVPILKAPVTAPDESTDELAWLDGFAPTIVLMGRNASNNGYYTCPWWIYDWITQNPEWYKNPDLCPHASAISTLKSLVYFVKRDGYVTIRETRNSRFVRIEF